MIENVSKFKYLGVIFDEFLNFKECANVLADSAGRALSAVISKCFPFKYASNMSTLRYWNCLMTMDYSCLTRKILEYDLYNFNNENWSGHVYRIAKILKCEENI